jgi:hypothetical protein
MEPAPGMGCTIIFGAPVKYFGMYSAIILAHMSWVVPAGYPTIILMFLPS